MKTFADIIQTGNAAEAIGDPLVSNWPQIRGAILMLGRAAGGIEQVRASDFESRFPENFDALDPATQEALPSEWHYTWIRGQVSRVLAVLGELDDPWEQLRMLIRRAGRDDIENGWYSLRRAALDAGLVPSDIHTDWVWSLEAEAAGGIPRQSLRRGVAVLNELFYIPEVLEAGLLPPDPIGPPPVYDRQGRRIYRLPPTLARYQASATKAQGGLQQVWQAVCASGVFNLPEDPSANDLLTSGTWDLIARLPQSITGVLESSWNQYLLRTRRVLLPYATIPVPEHLPERLEAMITQHADRWPIETLWRLMCSRNMTNAEPDDLLHLATWQELWRKVPQNTAASSWRQYEGRAWNILTQHAPHLDDPYQVVARAWVDLPKGAKVALDPIRKQAERALMRPLDLTPQWVAAQDLNPARKAQVTDVLREVFFAAAAQHQKAVEPDPIAVAWKTLRTTAQAQGVSTIGLNKIASPATDDGMAPQDLTPAWAAATAERMDYRSRAKFADALRKIDGLMHIPDLAPLLYAEPISALPDARKQGKIDPPEAMLCELESVHEAYGRAASTRREGRALLRKLWTAAVANGVGARTLGELLQAKSILAGLDRASQNKAARLLLDLNGPERSKAL